MTQNFIPVKATTGAIIIREGKILLTKRNIEPYKGYWCLPGGHIDYFEKAEDAITREVKEETGLNFTGRFEGYIDEIIPEKDWHAEFLVFKGTASGEEKMCEKEVQEMRWFEKEEAKKMELAFMHGKALSRFA